MAIPKDHMAYFFQKKKDVEQVFSILFVFVLLLPLFHSILQKKIILNHNVLLLMSKILFYSLNARLCENVK